MVTLRRQLLLPRLDPSTRLVRVGLVAVSAVLAGTYALFALPRLFANGSLGQSFEVAALAVLAIALIGATIGVEVTMIELERRRRIAQTRPTRISTGRGAVIGTAVGAALWVTGSVTLGWWVASVPDHRSLYGAIGGGLVVVLWVQLSTLAMLIAGLVTDELG